MASVALVPRGNTVGKHCLLGEQCRTVWKGRPGPKQASTTIKSMYFRCIEAYSGRPVPSGPEGTGWLRFLHQGSPPGLGRACVKSSQGCGPNNDGHESCWRLYSALRYSQVQHVRGKHLLATGDPPGLPAAHCKPGPRIAVGRRASCPHQPNCFYTALNANQDRCTALDGDVLIAQGILGGAGLL